MIFTKWLNSRRAKQSAKLAFQQLNPSTRVGWTHLYQSSADEFICCVCYGDTMPPQRSWWLVTQTTLEAKQISTPDDFGPDR